MIVKSRQDTYQYTHDQKQAGFSADVGFDGKPQSFSINGGKTDVDADYAQVTHQSGIQAQESTLSVQGQGKFTGGYLITDAGKNQTQFTQGIQTQDIENHLNYEGDAISVGIGIGADTSNPNGKAKPALQGLGYGTIDPVNKTSTTHTAITDQAGLSHINTESFKQAEVQNELNQIITNDFDKEQVLRDLNAQTVITTEFGKEAPQRVAEFADNQAFKLIQKLDELNDKNIDIASDEYQNTIKEIDKWSEGGIYRTALHTATAALATGTIEGAASAGTTAYAIPKIDEYLAEQGFDKQTRDITLLALSAGIGATVGGDTASTANNVGQVQWNYLLHSQMASWEKALAKCTNDDCRKNVIQEYLELSDRQQKNLEKVCVTNYNALQCESLRQKYFSLDETLTDINPSKLGGTNYWIRVDQQNKEAEAVWIDIARNSPSTSKLDKVAWQVHSMGGSWGRGGTYTKPSRIHTQPNTPTRKQTQIESISYIDKPKQKVNSSKVGSVVRTPNTHPGDFIRQGKNYTNIHTGEIWQKSTTQHSDKSGEWKVGLNKNGSMQKPTESKKITIGMNDGKIIKIENK